ncbi:MAG: response regulator [Nitrospira sp.]|nr:response regulator [Nitrospira sp.]
MGLTTDQDLITGHKEPLWIKSILGECTPITLHDKENFRIRQTPSQSILLVEDSQEDCEITVRSLRLAGLNNPITRCTDGDDALNYLFRRGTYQDPDPSFPPGIILLDLNLPGTDGLEILEELKKNPGLKSIPVVMLTTSTDVRNVRDCYARGARSYIHKPLDFDGFIKAMAWLGDYWFQTMTTPKEAKRLQ